MPTIQFLQNSAQIFSQRESIRSSRLELLASPETNFDIFTEEGFENLSQIDSKERVRKRLERLKELYPFSTAKEVEKGFERLISRDTSNPVSFLENGARAAKTVARVVVRSGSGMVNKYGSCFMISASLMMTSFDVISDTEEASNCIIEFDYETDSQGVLKKIVAFELDPTRFFYSDTELQFTVVGVKNVSGNGTALHGFGWNRLVESEGKILIGEYLNIIHHDQGLTKSVLLQSNQLIDVTSQFLHYSIDGNTVSSGAPIFNNQWEVVGIHLSGIPKMDSQGNILAKDDSIWDQRIDNETDIQMAAMTAVRISEVSKQLSMNSSYAEIVRSEAAIERTSVVLQTTAQLAINEPLTLQLFLDRIVTGEIKDFNRKAFLRQLYSVIDDLNLAARLVKIQPESITRISSSRQLPGIVETGLSLQTLSDRYLKEGGIGIGELPFNIPLIAKRQGWSRSWERQKNTDSISKALVATVAWQILFTGIPELRKFSNSKKYTVIITPSSSNLYNVIVLERTPVQSNPTILDVSLPNNFAPNTWIDKWYSFYLQDKRNRGIVNDLSDVLEYLYSFFINRRASLKILIAPEPEMIPTVVKSFNPGAPIGVTAPGKSSPTSTVGCFFYMEDETYATISRHAISPPRRTITAGTRVMIGSDYAEVFSDDVVSDSCIVKMDNGFRLENTLALRPPCSFPPRQYQKCEFHGLASGKKTTIVQEWSKDILFLLPENQIKVFTDPDINPGDSGAGLYDSEFLYGFAHYRSGVSSVVQLASWIWADSVFKNHDIKF